jgi:uncharacterized membrane-anchored protein YjiN (DUF445 family)
MNATGAPPGPSAARATQVRAGLVRARRRATLLLAVVTAVFVVVTISGAHGWRGYVQAAAEGSMVGGLADWFAVVALFRRPLGLPIPHTAVVVERKDAFGETLGSFVEEHFLTPDAVVERLRGAGVAARTAGWLRRPDAAQRVAAHVAGALVAGADALAEEDVASALDEAVRLRVERTPLAPLAGRGLGVLIADGRHVEVVTSGLRALERYVDEHRGALQARFRTRTPWWIPSVLEQRVLDRAVDGARGVLAEMAADPGHVLRRQLDERLASLAVELREDPDLIARGEKLKADLVANPQLRTWSGLVWRDVKAELRAQADDDASMLRLRLADAVAALGVRLETDPALAAGLEDALERLVRAGVERYHGEIGDLVSSTVGSWDAEETASRLELLLGRDLQFIRINGTVVGGLAGLALHVLAQLLG